LYSLLDLVLHNEKEDKEIVNFIDLSILQNFQEFKTYILEENSKIVEMRIASLNILMEFMKQTYKELDGKEQVKDKCLHLWGIPILNPSNAKKRQQPEKHVYDETAEDKKDEFTVFYKYEFYRNL